MKTTHILNRFSRSLLTAAACSVLGLSACAPSAPAGSLGATQGPAPVTSPAPGPASQADVYCEQQGFSVQSRTAADGSRYSACRFPDGSECDAGAYFRHECRPGTTAPAAAALSEEVLKGAEYRLPDVGAFRLQDGQFTYQYGSGATQVYKVGLSQAALGDLDGNGTPDAAVILWLNSGGSGTFIYVVAVANGAGGPRQLAAELLGDRIQVRKLGIRDGRITLEVNAFAEGDPVCCPSQLVMRSYRLDGASLKVISEVRPTSPAAGATPTVVARATAQPAPALDAALAAVRFNPALKRCDGEPARTMTDQTWQANAVEEGGYGTKPAVPGQRVTIQLRNKLGSATARYDVRVTVIGPDGSSARADAPLTGNDLLRLDYPQAFSGAQPTTPGTYTVIWQVNEGFVACWGWEVK